MTRPQATGEGAGCSFGKCRLRKSVWPNGWRMHRNAAPRRSSRPNRCARSSRWPVSSRPTRNVRSVNGATVNWRMRSCGVASSSRSRRGTPGGCSKEADLKPHLIRYWLTPAAAEPPEERDEQIADVCATYREAPARVAAGERVISTDEMTDGCPGPGASRARLAAATRQGGATGVRVHPPRHAVVHDQFRCRHWGSQLPLGRTDAHRSRLPGPHPRHG